MHQKGINQNELAKKLNITVQTLSAIVNAKSFLSTETLIRAAEYFNVTTDYILKGEQKIDSNLLYQHRKISQEISNKIKDVEGSYHNAEVTKLFETVENHNKTSIKDLVRLAIEILKGGDETTIHNLINSLDEQTYELLRQLNIEFIDSISKWNKRENNK